jgi:ribosome-associated heat shock protein Hsp15
MTQRARLRPDGPDVARERDDALRLDKWLWAARLFKSRGLAQDAIAHGRVLVDDERVKTARMLRAGETVSVRVGDATRILVVRGVAHTRGPASVAQQLYEETAASLAARETERERRRLYREPAQAIEGRPTKRDRRALGRARGEQ